MKKLSVTSQVFAATAIILGAIWLGSYVSRLFVSYNLFIDNELIIKDFITQENVKEILYLISPTFFISTIIFPFFIFSFVLFIFTSGLSLKENGWLFVISAIIFLTLPFEVFLLITIDFRIILDVLSGIDDPNLIVSLIVDRFKNLGSFPIIIIWCYITIPYFLIFKPFTTNKSRNED